MSIPLTETWNIHANGGEDKLVLNIDNAGNVTGQFGTVIEGFWDADAQRLVFQRMSSSPNVPDAMQDLQVFTGYYYLVTQKTSDNHQDHHHTLAGHFEAFVGTGATAQRVRYGWYARKTIHKQ